MRAARGGRRRAGRFRAHRGAKHGSAFRAHKGGFPAQKAFAAHARRAIKVRRARARAAGKAPRAALFKGTGTRNPFPVRGKAKPYKAAGGHAGAMRAVKRKKAAKFRAARARIV